MHTDTAGSMAGEMQEAKAATRRMWALGDYHRFAKELIWDVGPVVVEACGVRPGDRVLDVAAGSGNVALRAAAAGGRVVACDLTPENFEAGRREARELGVEVEWVQGDAEALPFGDDEFDVVASCFGAMFAPDHRRTAGELLRTCRPGGTIGVTAFTPGGVGGAFFAALAPFMPPPPPGAEPPVLWGDERHVRELFEGRAEIVELRRDSYVERGETPQAYCDFIAATFGPAIAIRAGLAGDAEATAAFDGALMKFATECNRGAPGGPAEYPYEYLLTVVRPR